MELPPLRVGEAAEVALNAAAMQELTMKQGCGPGYTNLHRGKFVFNSLAKGSDGERKSKDMSCVHDCLGHGAPTAPRRQRVGHGRSPRQKREVYKGDPEAEPPRDEPSPSSRAEAVAAADELRRSLLKYDARKTRRADLELPLWDVAFQAVVKQVSVHCNERGQLLEAIRTRYEGPLEKLSAPTLPPRMDG